MFRIPGQSSDQGDRGGCIILNEQAIDCFKPSEDLGLLSFSADVWFALKRTASTDLQEGNVLTGGILMGGQSKSYLDRAWAHLHQQFMMITKFRHPCLSFGKTNRPLAEFLEFDTWYHAVISFDSERCEETCYLNGREVQKLVGEELVREYRHLQALDAIQFGTGVISGFSAGKPAPEFSGWYPFNGYVDEARIWSKALSYSDVRSLYQGRYAKPEGGILFSVKRDVKGELYNRDRPAGFRQFGPFHCNTVRCTRPAERVMRLQQK